MKAKMPKRYTKGPWFLNNMNNYQLISADNTTVCRTVCKRSKYEDAANGRLISAAPELLEALEAVLPCIDGEEQFWAEIDLINKVIAKAKGNS